MSVMSPHSKRDVRPLLERGDLFRRPVAREDDLLVRVVERVEGEEELLLRALLAREEVNVVDKENVYVAIPVLELVRDAGADREDQVVHEAFRGDVRDAHPFVLLDDAVADRLDQVSLAEPRAAVDKERIVGARGIVGDGERRRVGETIELPTTNSSNT